MGYHPETLAFSFPPYPSGGTSLRGHPKPWSFARALYALKPWIGFDVWHIDPEKPGTGNRRDDSCGWFDRTAGEYSDAVTYVTKDTTTMHDVKLVLARRKTVPMPFYEGISEPATNPDEVRGYPRLTQADTLALVLMLARELETRRWWNGANGNSGAHASRWRRMTSRQRNVDGIAFELAVSPLDNLSSVDDPESMVRLIAAALNRKFRPWWRHPRWHVHHWRINFDLVRNVQRTFQRCGGCRKRLGFGYCPTSNGDGKLYHGACLGVGVGSAVSGREAA